MARIFTFEERAAIERMIDHLTERIMEHPNPYAPEQLTEWAQLRRRAIMELTASDAAEELAYENAEKTARVGQDRSSFANSSTTSYAEGRHGREANDDRDEEGRIEGRGLFVKRDKIDATGTARALGLISKTESLPKPILHTVSVKTLTNADNYRYRPSEKRTKRLLGHRLAPVWIAHVRNTYIVLDGVHRISAAKRQGLHTMKAYIIDL